jgi:hypothetical protein
MKSIYLLVVILYQAVCYSQCNLKTINRPDGNTIKYFNPKPVIRQSQYEVGSAIYKNETTGMYMVNISVLFKTIAPKNIKGKLTIQTTGKRGIELKLVKSEQVDMNGRKLAVGLYEIDKLSFEELKKYQLKSIFFYIDSKMYGATVTENKNVYMNELKCLIN